MTTTPSDADREPWEPTDEWFGACIKAQWTERDFHYRGYMDGLAAGRAELRGMLDAEIDLANLDCARAKAAEQKLAALVEGLRGVVDLASKATQDDAHHHLTCVRAALKVTIQSATPEKHGDTP